MIIPKYQLDDPMVLKDRLLRERGRRFKVAVVRALTGQLNLVSWCSPFELKPAPLHSRKVMDDSLWAEFKSGGHVPLSVALVASRKCMRMLTCGPSFFVQQETGKQLLAVLHLQVAGHCKSRIFRTHSIFVYWAIRPFVGLRKKFWYSR